MGATKTPEQGIKDHKAEIGEEILHSHNQEYMEMAIEKASALLSAQQITNFSKYLYLEEVIKRMQHEIELLRWELKGQEESIRKQRRFLLFLEKTHPKLFKTIPTVESC